MYYHEKTRANRTTEFCGCFGTALESVNCLQCRLRFPQCPVPLNLVWWSRCMEAMMTTGRGCLVEVKVIEDRYSSLTGHRYHYLRCMSDHAVLPVLLYVCPGGRSDVKAALFAGLIPIPSSQCHISARFINMAVFFVNADVLVGGGLAQLVTSLVASTNLINAGPG